MSGERASAGSMPHGTELAGMVERLKGARVVCVGDVMLDRFVYGHRSEERRVGKECRL